MKSGNSSDFGFTSAELRRLRALKTPAGIQRFLDELPYNLSYTARSPKKVLHDRTASCLEGGIFGAPHFVSSISTVDLDLEAEQDTDHVVAISRCAVISAVAKSIHRLPLSRARLSQPARAGMSYFNIYFNLRGERTSSAIFASSEPCAIRRSQLDDRRKTIWFIAEHLCEIPHLSCSHLRWKRTQFASTAAQCAAKWRSQKK